LISRVRWRTKSSRARWIVSAACSAVLRATKRIGRVTASQIAAASGGVVLAVM